MDANNTHGALSQPNTLIQMLRAHAERQPDKMAFTFLLDSEGAQGEQEEVSLTYGALDRRARAIGAYLHRASNNGQSVIGERTLLLFPPGLDFIAAFFGCLYAGVVAVPAYPPRLNRPSSRIQSIVADAQATRVLTTGKILQGLKKRFDHTPDLAALQWLNTGEIYNDLAGEWRAPPVTGDNLAFLQYTSGSTGTPKGVMLTHANILHNVKAIRAGFQLNDADLGACWLPSFHDMGLIGGILTPLYQRVSSMLMAPAAFLQRPVRWLEMISRYRATISGAPNFAYKMCVDKITPEQREGLDLSSWKVAFCGAEPIRIETLEAFVDAFAPHGFRRQSFYPCYGLAESTLLVTGSDGPVGPLVTHVQTAALAQGRAQTTGAGEADAVAMVSCGSAKPGHRVVIANPDTKALCMGGEIGEIWAAGPSVAGGYWQRPSLSEEVFNAYVADSGDGPFLRTGDLGFLRDGQLYVTGRLKNLIIIRGQNYYPHDIEYTVSESHVALENGMGAAFSVVIDGEEKLVVVHEMTRRDRKMPIEAILPAVRAAIAREQQLQLHALTLIRPLSMPRTSSGKIRRHACKEMFQDGSLKIIAEWRSDSQQETADRNPGSGNGEPRTRNGAQESSVPEERFSHNLQSEIRNWLVKHLAELLKVAPEQIDGQRPLVDFGLDSVQAVELVVELEKRLGRSLAPTLVWDYPTIEALAKFLATHETEIEETVQATPYTPHSKEPIAVVGIGCRFPGADGPDAFWQLLQDGRDSIGEAPPDRWPVGDFYDDGPEPAPGKMNTRWGGFLEGVDQFDADFFGIAPREAARMDPQQRLLLEVAWEALEHAGIDPARLAGSMTGVFVGISSYDYSRLQFSHPDRIDAYAGTGNAHSIAANRLSYLLDLRGPSVAIDTACSSSLVAAHMAMNSLRREEADVALAGGVNLILSPELTIAFSQARMMAPDGRCKTFDAAADGYVRGEGCGVLVLKRLSDAERDGDPILAVLRGSAVNQDGRSNGLTAPNGLAQQAVIRRALADAAAEAGDISAVEAHGTGTRLGDPIEVHALQAVFDKQRNGEPLVVGAVKTNVGHLEAAAGVVGLIKMILALVHEEIPSHLHLHAVNPHIDLENSCLAIDGRAHAWPRTERQRLAGVSSFGFGGTNAHVIVGEAPPGKSNYSGPGRSGVRSWEWGPQLLLLSARDDSALREMALRYAAFLEDNPKVSLADVCYTAAVGRARFAERLAVVAETAAEMRTALREEAIFSPQVANPSITFLFTGQGAQYPGMGRRLYESEPVFRAALERCEAILAAMPETTLDSPANSEITEKLSLLDVLFAAEEESLIDETQYTQPALFAVEYALAQLWRSWGIEADMVLGHSVGEYVAACVAGVMSLEDGLRLVAARGRLMGQLPPGEGSMAAVFAPATQVREAVTPLEADVSIAALNGPNHVVISGKKTAVLAAVEALNDAGVETRPLTVSHAFHSPLMEPMLDAFEAVAAQCRFQAPRIPFVSNLTGELLDEAPDARYWRDHVRQPVRFAAGIQTAADAGATVFLEIGPQPHLTGMARRIFVTEQGSADSPASSEFLASMRKGWDDRRVILDSLGQLFALGFEPDMAGAYSQGASHIVKGVRRIHLPSYPFQHERFWLETGESLQHLSPARVRPLNESASAREPVRLATAVPLFEAQLDFAPDGGNANLLRDHATAVAAVFWGLGAHAVGVFEQISVPDNRQAGPVRVQTTLSPIDGRTAAFQIFAYDEPEDSWILLAAGEIRRGQRVEIASEPVPDKMDGHAHAPPLTAGASMREALQAATPQDRQRLLKQYLEEALAVVVGLGSRRKIRADRPLDTLGLDSLMALELKNRFERELGMDLPVVKLLQGPTVDELAGQLAELRPGGFLADKPAIAPLTETGQPAPLSYGQQAMWVLHQLLPTDVSLNVAGAARISGALDTRALERALAQLVAQHGALRTTFSVSRESEFEGWPVQIVQPAMNVLPLQVNATTWDDETIEVFLQQEAHRPFDLHQGPLLRLVLLKQAAQEHVLLLAINHLITDFWSMSLVVRDLYLLYRDETEDGQSGETAERQDGNEDVKSSQHHEEHTAISEIGTQESKIQVADYARWQAEMLDSEAGAAHRDYWLQKLSGELPRLDLPTDRPRPAVQTYDGDNTIRRVDPALTKRLKVLSQEQGVTLATTLAAAFQTLLHRYSGQDELLLGTVIAGREHPELQELVGYLINPVALRADFSGRPSFLAFLAQVRQTLLEAIDHQDYPLARLAEALAADGRLTLDPGRPPLFETMFIMQRAQVMQEQGLSAFALGVPGASLKVDALTIESRPLGGLPAQFDLTLMAAEVGEDLTLAFHYNTHLFDDSTIMSMLAHLEMLLEGIAAGPERPVDEIPLLTTAERRQQLVAWNETQANYPREKTMHQLVAEQARRTPERTAVTFEGVSWSYAELERRAGQLADHLRQRGVKPGALVGLYVERSLDMMAGLLGILKAGGAYIPLDPDFPDERVRLMLEDARPIIVVTQERLAERLDDMDLSLLCLDGEQITVDSIQQAVTNEQEMGCAEDLAYVIYTSGSTGRPKGVQITHRSAVNFLASMQREPGIDVEDRLLAVTTLSFDIALLELFLPLISGAEVVIASREAAMDGVQLQRLLSDAGITIMQATPASWRLLLESGWAGKNDLKALCGGEALPPDLAQKLLPRCRALWNMYGPTETTVWSTIARIRSATGPIPIGRPIANTQVYLLDDKRQPVPVGAVGQLYIGGAGVSRGYWERPELTAERFVPDPFVGGDNGQARGPVPTSGPVMYRTGDLARYLPDGNLLHLGRDDFQVKVRGYRIELGDIETAVARHPAVVANVTVAREVAAGEKRLVTYWVPQAGQEDALSTAELRAFLRPHLPEYMIPSQLVTVEEFPKTPNGKIDRRDLPEPLVSRDGSEAEYVAPRSDLEEEVAALCAEVLGLERVGVFDNFFDLGGNSLSAARLVFQARERFGVQIPLRQLFQQPTIAGLSQCVEAERQNGHFAGGNGHRHFDGTLIGMMTRPDLQAEAESQIAEFGVWSPEFEYAPHTTPDMPRDVLLTGATGFLGAYLLRDLLSETAATVHCLVRAADTDEGLSRIRQNMANYELWDDAYAARIRILPGDLARPLLGLPKAQFAEMAENMDAVYHNGAMVNFVYSYREHKAANVLGTREILRLAAAGNRPTPVHFVSTLSVFHDGQHDHGTLFMENADLDGIGTPFGGYAQSKWVAEKMIVAAMVKGMPAAIYRPGLISGDSALGAWNTSDLMSTMVLACAATGAAPELDVAVDIVPVDYASRAIVTLAGRPESLGQTFHLSNPQPASFSDLLAWAQTAGLPLQVLPFEQWRAGMMALATQLGGENWNPFLPLLEEVTAEQIFMPAIDCRHTLAGLAAAAKETGEEPIQCPAVDAHLLNTYFSFFRRQGLLSISGAAS